MISKLNPTFIALTGPTTSGKTQLSCALARILEVEIISMDSRQVYKGKDIVQSLIHIYETTILYAKK